MRDPLNCIDPLPFSKICSVFRSFLFVKHDCDSSHYSCKAFQQVSETESSHRTYQAMAYIIIVELLI